MARSLAARTVSVETVLTSQRRVAATLDQGKPEVIGQPDPSTYGDIAEAIGLSDTDLHTALRPEVISTGLRYLIVPVTSTEALSRAHIDNPDLENFLPRVQPGPVTSPGCEPVQRRSRRQASQR